MSAAVPAANCVRSVLWYGVTSAYVMLTFPFGFFFFQTASTVSNAVRSDVSAEILRLLALDRADAAVAATAATARAASARAVIFLNISAFSLFDVDRAGAAGVSLSHHPFSPPAKPRMIRF